MTWARDFSCNNIRCKNYKVKLDADTEHNFCESCTAQIRELGLCLSCGVRKASSDEHILFPWLCEECESAAKAEFFNRPLSLFTNRRHSIRDRNEPIRRQMPRPGATLFIVIILSLLSIKIGTNSFLGSFLLTLISLFLLWIPVAIILEARRDR
jgi:hypothetical protein